MASESNQDQTKSIRDSRQLIINQPYKPPRRLKPYQIQVECTDIECRSPERGKPHNHIKTITPSDGGSGRLERKANGEIIYHTPWTKPHVRFKDSVAGKCLTPKPRIETSTKAFERMKKECTAQVTENRTKALTGQDACKGYRIVATNGYWALIEQGKGNGGKYDWLGNIDKYKASTLADPELWNILQCASIMSDERSCMVHVMSLAANTVTVYANHSDIGEYIGTANGANGRTETTLAFTANWKYLEIVLGTWPLTVWFKDEESAVVFEPYDKSWRFVLMPMPGDLKRVKEIVARESEVSE